LENRAMNRVTTGLSAFLLAAASSLPVVAQQADPASDPVTYILCTGDYVCVQEPSVVATWPLERWDSVRRQGAQASSTVPSPAGEQQLARRLGNSPDPTTP
jgi:hypothetical protein